MKSALFLQNTHTQLRERGQQSPAYLLHLLCLSVAQSEVPAGTSESLLHCRQLCRMRGLQVGLRENDVSAAVGKYRRPVYLPAVVSSLSPSSVCPPP